MCSCRRSCPVPPPPRRRRGCPTSSPSGRARRWRPWRGWSGRCGSTTAPGAPSRRGGATPGRLCARLARVGVQVTLDVRSDFSAEVARRTPSGPRAYDLYLRRLGADYAHPNTFFTLFEKSGLHQTGWETQRGGEPMARFESLLERADAEPDAERARELYAQAQALLLDEMAVIAPLYHPDRYFRARAFLHGVDVDPFNFLSLRELRLDASAPEGR